MSTDYRFQDGFRRPMARVVHDRLDACALAKDRKRIIRGLASTLECTLGAIGGYSYAALLDAPPGTENREALRIFVERQADEAGDVPPIEDLLRLARRALDRATDLRDGH